MAYSLYVRQYTHLQSFGPRVEDFESVSGRFLGILDRSRSECFQMQPVTCGDLMACLYEFEVYLIYSSKRISNFPEILN